MRDCLTASKNHILDGLFPAATTALIVALDAVGNGGTRKQVLLCVTDRREARTTYFYKAWFGDGAVALTLGREDVIAECKGVHSVCYDFVPHYRSGSSPCGRVNPGKVSRPNLWDFRKPDVLSCTALSVFCA
ncbi:MAG: hypothetical protein QNI95_07015 [Desulfobacterales bacterium]|nr:hypothetical protein [Desulfobacterales bacterium]